MGLKKTSDGKYHFLDANVGWFRLANKEAFKEWLPHYLKRTRYDTSDSTYGVEALSPKFTLKSALEKIMPKAVVENSVKQRVRVDVLIDNPPVPSVEKPSVLRVDALVDTPKAKITEKALDAEKAWDVLARKALGTPPNDLFSPSPRDVASSNSNSPQTKNEIR